MKIGFTGSHGTGKTSLMNKLGTLSEFADYELVGSTSREVKRMGLPINQEATPYSQLLITNMRDLVEHWAGLNFISDRTVLDSMAYTAYQFDHVWPKTEEVYTVLNVSRLITANSMKKYDHVFYFPLMDGPVTSDGTRPTDPEYQARHDRYIQEYLKGLRIPYTRICDGSINDRAVHVLSVVQLNER